MSSIDTLDDLIQRIIHYNAIAHYRDILTGRYYHSKHSISHLKRVQQQLIRIDQLLACLQANLK